MTRIVLDTNVLVSSFFGGKPRAIIRLWGAGELVLCLSRPIMDEYRRVLNRMGLADRQELFEIMDLFARGHSCLYAAATPSLRVVAQDPDDDKFLECAVALKARAVVTGDKALLEVGDYCGVAVLAPAEFLDRLAEFEPA